MEKRILNFIQSNSPDGGFLQSEHWQKFQESVGRKAYDISASDENGEPLAYARVITHSLPIAGNYFYIPRGPVVNNQQSTINNQFFRNLSNLAKKNNAGWIRIEPNSGEELKLIQDNLPKGLKMKKAAVDMQPREILVVDISKSEEEILAGMKQKTRYNIKLAEKKNIRIYNSREEKYIEEFLRLVDITAKRDGITSHPENYYRKMIKAIPGDVLKLYIAEFEGKIIAANLVLFFGKTATYMHGASDNEHRNLMAPYLLQWQQIIDAKKAGCERYDFGGVKTEKKDSSWSGITKFKIGFAPAVESIQFSGCYDIILKPVKYYLYRALQKIKRIF
jgi:peptidoglycan pentaglycine glycine transferase (the first glycine)